MCLSLSVSFLFYFDSLVSGVCCVQICFLPLIDSVHLLLLFPSCVCFHDIPNVCLSPRFPLFFVIIIPSLC